MSKKRGKLQLLFHSHLPFVKHPDSVWFSEELWFFQALSESYLPLFRVLNKLESENIPIDLTFSFSPTLLEMCKDYTLSVKYIKYLERMIALAEKELKRLNKNDKSYKMASFYYGLHIQNYSDYLMLNRNVFLGFKKLEQKGLIKIVTSCATYAYLPLYQGFDSIINAQIELGLDSLYESLGKESRGFWLPECGYVPGFDKILKKNRIEYSFLSPDAVLFLKNSAKNGVFKPIVTIEGITFFLQDILSNAKVNSQGGFPSHPLYREFYRDIGFDLDLEYIKDYVNPSGSRIFTGFKYHKISGSEKKDLYNLDDAENQCKAHAKEFVESIRQRYDILKDKIDGDIIFTNYYNTELFGHRWFEGINWLYYVLKEVNESDFIESCSAQRYMDENNKSEFEVVSPVLSSWGSFGHSHTWLNSNNRWVYKYIYSSIIIVSNMLKKYQHTSEIKKRALNQAVREMLLLQMSDFAVMASNKITAQYAKRRMQTHFNNMKKLIFDLYREKVDMFFLNKLEQLEYIFPHLDSDIV